MRRMKWSETKQAGHFQIQAKRGQPLSYLIYIIYDATRALFILVLIPTQIDMWFGPPALRS